MKKLILSLALSAAFALPAFAALKPGDTAPDFTAQGSLGGKDFTFNLKSALKKGLVVVYFYPSRLYRRLRSGSPYLRRTVRQVASAGATIVGVSADDLGRLKQFSADPAFCAGKFPIASDADTKIAQSYQLNVTPPRAGAKDVNQVEIGHAFIERVTYVIGKDGKVLATLSSKSDGLSPDQHVEKSLAIVSRK